MLSGHAGHSGAGLGLEECLRTWAPDRVRPASGAGPPPPPQQRSFPGSVNGDVRFFDPRMPESVNVLQIVKGLTALDIHPQANLIAW